MMRRRWRSTGKWAGAALVATLLVLWIGSARFMVWSKLRDDFALSVQSGCLVVLVDGSGQFLGETGFEFTGHDRTFEWWFWSEWIQWNPLMAVVFIPIWFIALLVALPTAWLWCRDRRRATGLCIKCGYDLRGADHAACPECGAAVHGVCDSNAAA